MSDKTAISWSDATWNPVVGCTKVGEGCRFCFIDQSNGLRFTGPNGPNEIGARTDVILRPELLDQPLRWTRGRKVFVNSQSDLFHADIPTDFIAAVFSVMACAPQHTFQILTKRPARMAALLNSNDFWALVAWKVGEWSIVTKDGKKTVRPGLDVFDAMNSISNHHLLPNVWLGTSVENQWAADLRIPKLIETPAAIRFLSCEPLLGPVDLTPWVGDGFCSCTEYVVDFSDPERFHGENLELLDNPDCEYHHPDLHWVIVGGESGKNARPMHPDWVRSLRDQCDDAGVAFWFKQWGEWIEARWKGEDGATHAFTGSAISTPDGPVPYFMELDHKPTSLERNATTPAGALGMRRVGKRIAGHVLDGEIHQEFPQITAAL